MAETARTLASGSCRLRDSMLPARVAKILRRLSLPRGAVDDRLAVGGEPRLENRAATEGEAFVRRTRGLLSDRAEAPAGEKPEPEQRSCQERLAPGPRGSRTSPWRESAPRDRGERLEVVREVPGGLEPPFGVLLEAVTHEPLEAGVDVLVRDGKVGRVLLQDRRHRLAGRVAPERALAREHLVQDHAESEDVASSIGGLGLDLLGRYVAERSHDDDPARSPSGARTRSAEPSHLGQLREAEVEDLDAAVSGHEEVLGLQVPVDDALLVGGGQALGDLGGVVDGLARGEAPSGELRAQRLALEQLLNDVGSAIVLADVVDDRDVGVVEHPRRPGFLLEALQPVRVSREGSRKDLDRDVAAEPRVSGPVYLAHSARTQRRQNLVGAEASTRRQRHSSCRQF